MFRKSTISLAVFVVLNVSTFAHAATFHDAAQVQQGRAESQRYGSAISQGREAAAHSERYGSHSIDSNVAKAEANAATRREAVAHESRYSGMTESRAVGEAQATAIEGAANRHAEALSHEARYSGIVQSMKVQENQLRTVGQIQARQAAIKNAVAQSHAAQITAGKMQGMDTQPAATMTASTQPANSTINQAAQNVNPHTPVSVTVNGVTTETTAGEIAKTDPQAQISMPLDSVFNGPVRSSNNNRDHSTSHGEHGTGNGGNNAANSNSAHGLGGGSHIGGGSAQGGGFHGNW